MGYTALLLASVVIYRLSGVTFRQMFRVRLPPRQSPPPLDASMDNARQLAAAGLRIQAITLVRQLHGLPLREAVAVVEELERRSRS